MAETDGEKSEEFETIGDGPMQRADSDDNIFKTTDKISALDIAWNFDDPGADAALTEYKKRGLRYKDLASLEDKDLELLGIKDGAVRARMIQDFGQLPNQEPGYDATLKTTDMTEYNSTVLSNISDHINNLKMSLMAAQVKLKIAPPEDVLIDEKIYGSDLVMKTIDKMMKQCDEMHVKVDEIVGEHFVESQKSTGFCKKLIQSMLWIGAIVLTTYAGHKIIRAKLK